MRERTRWIRKAWNTRSDRGSPMRSRRTLAGSLALALLLAITLAAPVLAQDDEDPDDPFAGLYRKRSLYLIAMGNYMIPTRTSSLEREANKRLDAMFGPGTTTHVNNSWGLNGRAGFRASEHFAFETQFEYLNNIELDHRLGTLMNQNTDISMLALTGNAKGYLSGRGRFQPYLLGGLGWGRATTNPGGAGAKSRDDGFLYRFGAGLELYGKPDVGVTVEASYVIPTGNIDDLQYFSIGAGVMLRFFPGGY